MATEGDELQEGEAESQLQSSHPDIISQRMRQNLERLIEDSHSGFCAAGLDPQKRWEKLFNYLSFLMLRETEKKPPGTLDRGVPDIRVAELAVLYPRMGVLLDQHLPHKGDGQELSEKECISACRHVAAQIGGEIEDGTVRGEAEKLQEKMRKLEQQIQQKAAEAKAPDEAPAKE